MQKQILETKLNKALMDEYHARDTYQKILDTFGDIRPFSNIVAALGVALFHWNPSRNINKG